MFDFSFNCAETNKYLVKLDYIWWLMVLLDTNKLASTLRLGVSLVNIIIH